MAQHMQPYGPMMPQTSFAQQPYYGPVDINNYMYAQTKSEVNTKLPKDVEKLV